jgi:hypothetical protein
MKTSARVLTPDEAHTVQFGLRIAAERYLADAAQFPDHKNLETQFKRQAEEAIKLAELIDNADEVELRSHE